MMLLRIKLELNKDRSDFIGLCDTECKIDLNETRPFDCMREILPQIVKYMFQNIEDAHKALSTKTG